MKPNYLVMLCLLLPRLATAEWQELATLPDKEGVAGAFAGVSHDALLVAGGANFPGSKPWDGGKKAWYDTVYVLEAPAGKWKVAGRLPRKLGYGVSVTHHNSVVCVGGSDAERHYADAFRLTWQDGKLQTTALPPLPHPIANACGALVNDTLYVAGGLQTPAEAKTLTTVYCLDLVATKPQWRATDTWPGRGRMLAVAASFDDAFWLIGGCDLEVDPAGKLTRRYLQDAYRYDSKAGWKRVADLSRAVVAAPSPAPHDATGFYVLGGDDGAQLTAHPTKHRGFPKTILRYDPRDDEWRDGGVLPTSVVTVPCVAWRDAWVLTSGEVRPGVRTPQVWRWTIDSQE